MYDPESLQKDYAEAQRGPMPWWMIFAYVASGCATGVGLAALAHWLGIA